MLVMIMTEKKKYPNNSNTNTIPILIGSYINSYIRVHQMKNKS